MNHTISATREHHSSKRLFLSHLWAMSLAFFLLTLPNLALAKTTQVVATIPALAAIAREIGGDDVKVASLSAPSQDPHFVDPRPSLALSLNRADLLLLNGLDLEVGWLPTLINGARNNAIQPGNLGHLDCSSAATILGKATGPVDRRQGDIHPSGNPHYLVDPKNALSVARAIAERLSQIDPDKAQRFQGNLKAFEAKHAQKVVQWESQMGPLKGQAIVSYHSSWLYLADWLGLREVAFVEPKPGIAPTPAHVTQVLATGRREKVRLLIQEKFYSDSTSKLIAQKIPCPMVKLPSGPDFKGGQTYFDFMDDLVSLLASALPQGAQAEAKKAEVAP